MIEARKLDFYLKEQTSTTGEQPIIRSYPGKTRKLPNRLPTEPIKFIGRARKVICVDVGMEFKHPSICYS